jgi:biopolymer transport protein ExbB
VLAACVFAPAAAAQEPVGAFERAASDVEARLAASLARLAELQRSIADETVPLSASLHELEEELTRLRARSLERSSATDRSKLELTTLRARVAKEDETSAYLANLLGQYLREFEVRLHVAELPRHAAAMSAARDAAEDGSLAADAAIHAQAALLDESLARLEAALGGARFPGAVIGPGGRQVQGTFLVAGPAALFRSDDGTLVGTAEQRLNSSEPAVFAFADPEDAAAAGARVAGAGGSFVLDPSLGNAHRMEATEQETFFDEFAKGGPVMYPIFGMAGIALLIGLFKWAGLAFIPKPSKSRMRTLLEAVRRGDQEAARQAAAAIRGPSGRMLTAGVEHLREPRELIEEVMYENVLQTKVRVQRLLPFVAICAASAPLLGLLGTVTGIMNTFRMITIYGSGDVKNLSGGISEALITTKYGLIVAIPALLLHAFLSRKARGVVGQMEGAAIAFVNEVSKSPGGGRGERGDADNGDAVRAQVGEVLRELLEPVLAADDSPTRRVPAGQAG